MFREAIARMRQAHGGALAWLTNHLAWNLRVRGRPDAAAQLWREVLAPYGQVYGSSGPAAAARGQGMVAPWWTSNVGAGTRR